VDETVESLWMNPRDLRKNRRNSRKTT